MTHYKSNLRDMFFNLFEVNRVQDHLGTGPYEQMDADSAKDVLREVDRLAREDFAASFVAGDRTPLQLDAENGEVTLPKEINETLDAFFAPFNERLYRWASARNIDFGRWDNATSSRLDVS